MSRRLERLFPSRLGSSALCLALLAAPAAAQHGRVRSERAISSTQGGFTGTLANDYRFGVSVADIGDLDGDGTIELAVGSHRANQGGPERGALWILFLNPDGTVRRHQEISSTAGGFTGLIDDLDRFGVSVCSLGDLDGDGTNDLAVGAYHDDDGGVDVGAVWILFLDPDGTVKAHQKISASAGGFQGSLAPGDSFGWSVEALGDLDGDGVVDLAIGASRDDNGESVLTRDFGAVWLCFLNADGSVRTQAKLGASSAGVGPELRWRDRFGSDVAALGDADGDGVLDIAVGGFSDEPTKVGNVWVLDLNRDGTVKAHQRIGLGAGGFSGQLDIGDRFGISLAAEDLDGDGLSDLFIGASGDDDAGLDAGALWACLLAADGSVRATDKVSVRAGGFGGDVQPGDAFGVSCAALGDLDQDGAFDLAVGAYQDDDGGFDRGGVWLLLRSGATDLPAADFEAAPTSGQAPLSVSFTDRSGGLVSSWLWDFGDGASSSAASPIHDYLAPGLYTVALTVAGPLGSDGLTRGREVNTQPGSAPVASFVGAPTVGVAPLLVAFQDTSSGVVSAWSWGFGDGQTSSESAPVHLYPGPGSYTLSLTVSGPGGSNTRTSPGFVTVSDPAPVASFSASPTAGPAPLTVTFTDQSSGNITGWLWDSGDGASSTMQSPVHVYRSPGSYGVTLTVSGPGGTNSLVRSNLISVGEPPPVAAFGATPTSGLAPLSVAFSDQSTGSVASWLWTFGDGASSTLRNPVHVYTSPGSYGVTLAVSGPGGSNSLLRSNLISVGEPPPVAAFGATPTEGFPNLAVAFGDLSSGNITSRQWDFGDGTGSLLSNPTHLYTQVGIYTVSLLVAGPGGASTLQRVDWIHVNEPPPNANFSAVPRSGVAPLLVTFQDLSTLNVTGWEWDFGDGARSTLQNPVHVYRTPGAFTVRLRVTSAGGVDGTPRRDFIHVDDIVKLTDFVKTQKPASGLYNCGTGKARTFHAMMEALFHALKKPLKIEWIDTPEQYRKAYQYFTEADMSHTIKAGYDAKFLSLEEGVSKYVAWLLAHETAPIPKNFQ